MKRSFGGKPWLPGIAGVVIVGGAVGGWPWGVLAMACAGAGFWIGERKGRWQCAEEGREASRQAQHDGGADEEESAPVLSAAQPETDPAMERRIVELQEERDRALAESHAKSEFLAIMSHEIRTPMNVVLGMLELLREAALDHDRKEQVRLAYGSGKTLLALIDNVLDFSKMEADRLVLDEVDFDLRALVDESALILATLAHTKEIELTPFFPHDMATHVRGDVNRLRQIFTNLLGNAIKFTPEGGSVELHGGPVGLGAEGRTEYLFEVRDTGPGVPEEERERIFDLFARAEGHRSVFPGTGLGLAISRRLVERMGGTIGVDVNPYAPSGSVFHFTIQLTQQPASAEGHPGRDLFCNLRVLGVEIDGLQRLFLEDVFQLFGSRFDFVAEAETALGLLRQARVDGQPYDLVLLNQKPGQDGRVACRALRDADSSWKFILLTDLLDQGWDHASELPGMAICLKKPLSAERLRSAIEWLLSAPDGEARLVPIPVRREAEPVRYDARILVVDDHAANLTVARGMLVRLGCEAGRVVGAKDGREGVERFIEQDFDLVFMDCQMPGVDGYEASRLIRQWERERELPPVPIVAFTANVTSGSRLRGEVSGMNDFLSKPVTLGELRKVLERYLIPVATATPTPVEARDPAPMGVGKSDLEILMGAMESIGLPEEDFRDVAGLLVNQIPELLESLERDLRGGEHETARATAHVLKGSMANTIFPQLQPHTRQLHECIKGHAWHEAGEALKQVRLQFEPVRKALDAFLGRLPES
ncbi:MAG: response regulator [Magnetococcales bacterium]|nr:response regulator [Magnetococcales bacterium]